jgi:ubiquinone/menaquinone biosynthesis C-methylase UbiE
MASARSTMSARVYDIFMLPQERLGIRRQRVRLCGSATGRVLEVAIGTGLNIPHYRGADFVVGVDFDPSMLRRAIPRTWESKVPVRLVAADAHSLPFPDSSFDSVVIALSLCTIPNSADVLEELSRVSIPGGRLHFLEHVRSAKPSRARLQDRFSPAWERISGGCKVNQDTLQLIEASSWAVEDVWTSDGGSLIQGTAIST